eukprot:6364406-Pyramimonas_sp.AAC.1
MGALYLPPFLLGHLGLLDGTLLQKQGTAQGLCHYFGQCGRLAAGGGRSGGSYCRSGGSSGCRCLASLASLRMHTGDHIHSPRATRPSSAPGS